MIIFLPNHVKKCLNQLNSNSFSAFCVGGAVRDALLGQKPDDYDIATSATPQQVTMLFDRVIPTGIKHGTVTVIIDNIPIEVTTFRTDGDYSDSRHPEKVNFVADINSDLSRRDFTVNAFAYSKDGDLIDNFNGLTDLKTRTIRCVGDAKLRFTEDALRILRAFRFCSVLDFTMEENTKQNALDLADSLINISRERIYNELSKLICGKNPSILTELLKVKIPNYLKPQKIDDHIFKSLGNIKADKNIRYCFFCLATDINPIYLFENLKADNNTKQTVNEYLKTINSLPFTSKSDIKRALSNISANDLCDLIDSYAIIFNVNCANYINDIKQIVANREPYLIKHLNIKGDDILKLDFKEKQIGSILKNLLEQVLEDPSLNTSTKLKQLVKNYIKI